MAPAESVAYSGESVAMESTPRKSYDISEEIWEEGQMPQTRYFLRAYATFKLPEEGSQKMSFHAYYMQDTCNRLLKALEDLTKFRKWWYDQRRNPESTLSPFLMATWEEMLTGMRQAPSTILQRN
jgi:hypothetical protein